MDKQIQSFLATKRTFDKRRHAATLNPTRENCFALAQAGFALSMARVRLLRLSDQRGYALMNAQQQAVSMKQALISFTNFDPSVQQMSLGI